MSISLGKSKSKSSSQQQQTSTQTLAPELSAALYGNIARAQGAAGSLTPYTGQRVAGFNANQTAAQGGLLNLAGAHVGAGLLGAATGAATGASTYRPTSISVAPAVGAAPVTAAQAAARPDVTSGPITADAITGYMNPYENAVVQASLADLERQRQIEQTYNAAQATRAKAFGGTGSAILSAQTNDAYARNAAQSAASLRSQGFNTALSAAQADAARQLSADQGNQQAGNEMAMFNASKTQEAGLFNAGQANTLAQFNAGQALEAQRSNQAAGLSGAQLNLDAARALAGMSDQERAHALEDVGLVSQVGDAQQAQAQRELDGALAAWRDGQELTLKQQEVLNAAIALLPNYGTTRSSGTASSKGSQIGFNAGFDILKGK
jgi:hypothetical protein